MPKKIKVGDRVMVVGNRRLTLGGLYHCIALFTPAVVIEADEGSSPMLKGVWRTDKDDTLHQYVKPHHIRPLLK